MDKISQLWFKTFNVGFGKYSLSLPVFEIGAIILLLFLLVLSLAQFRRHYMDWSFKGALFGIFFGFLLALTLEGFLIIGGKTALTEVLGWKNAPKPLQVALDAGKTKLIQVLGTQTAIPVSFANDSTFEGAIESIQAMSPADLKKVRNLICAP